jgi:putative membrane protein
MGTGGLALAYLLAWRRDPARRAADPACALGGLGTLLVALNGPLHDLAEGGLFSAHMVQHLLLQLVVAPLLLAGTPPGLLDGLLGPLLARRPTRALVDTAVRPVPALVLFTVALAGWHLPGPHGAALSDHRWHVAQHLTLLATAVVAWWPVLSRSRRLPCRPYGVQILYLFALGVPMTVVAAMITGAEHVLYPAYAAAARGYGLAPLADQRLGGLIMWVPAGVVPLVAFTAVFFRWAAAEADEEAVCYDRARPR